MHDTIIGEVNIIDSFTLRSVVFLTAVFVFSFIINLAKAISYRGSAAINSFKRIAPSFLWILRDALLRPVNSQEYPCSFQDYLLEVSNFNEIYYLGWFPFCVDFNSKRFSSG